AAFSPAGPDPITMRSYARGSVIGVRRIINMDAPRVLPDSSHRSRRTDVARVTLSRRVPWRAAVDRARIGGAGLSARRWSLRAGQSRERQRRLGAKSRPPWEGRKQGVLDL